MSRILQGVFTLFFTVDCPAELFVTNEKELNGIGLNLRGAIENASDGETIVFDENLASLPLEISLGELLIDKAIVIEGLGNDTRIAIAGDGSSRLFRITDSGHLTLRFLKLSGGREFSDYGGGITSEGILTIEDCEISQCRATSGGGITSSGTLNCLRAHFHNNEANNLSSLQLGGGAILNQGTAVLFDCLFEKNKGIGVLFGGGAIHSRKAILTATNCIFKDNEVNGTGGGIFNSGELRINKTWFTENRSTDDGGAIFNEANLTAEPVSAIIENSTFSFNRSQSDSGAIHLSRNSEAMIENSTIAENHALDAGGAIENSQGTLYASACTIANNSGDQRGGGIFNIGETTLKNCILSGNATIFRANDLELFAFDSAIYLSAGANLIEAPGNSKIALNPSPDEDSAVILSGPALLHPLENYGGDTRTMPPGLNSPALNAALNSTLNTDQRGYTRFIDAFPDLGAVEFLGVANDAFIDSDRDGLSNGIEVLTGTDPLSKDPENPNHFRILATTETPTLSFGFTRSLASRYLLRVMRSTDLGEETEVLSSGTTFIPNSIDTPFLFEDEAAPVGRAFYRLEVSRR